MADKHKITNGTCNGCIHYWPLYNPVCKECEDRDHYEDDGSDKEGGNVS